VEEFRHAPTDAKRLAGVISLAAVIGGPHPHLVKTLVEAAQRRNTLSAAMNPASIIQMRGPSMKSALLSWQLWAVLSAGFAALTAIFAKVGVENVNSDFATFVRTIVILCALGAILAGTGQWQSLSTVSARSYSFLVLSGLATGGSWVCYFRALKLGDAARVAPIDKMSVVLVAVFGVVFLGERLSTPNWLGVALIAAGAVLVAYKS
jgi:transporter family protein